MVRKDEEASKTSKVPGEESKEGPQIEHSKLEAIESRVTKVLDALEPKKKANPSNKFRTFMNTQKNDLKQMVLPPKQEADVVMVGGFSGTVQLPKNAPLINQEVEVANSTAKTNG